MPGLDLGRQAKHQTQDLQLFYHYLVWVEFGYIEWGPVGHVCPPQGGLLLVWG